VIAGAGGLCAICSRPLVPGAPRFSDWATEVDHYPIPLHVMRDDYKAGRVSLATFNGRANDPKGCRAIHRKCHIDRDVVGPTSTTPVPTPPRTRSPEWDDL